MQKKSCPNIDTVMSLMYDVYRYLGDIGNIEENIMTQIDTKGAQAAAAYVPWKTFLTSIEALMQGLPPRLDRSMWPSLSGGVQSHVLSAFRFMGFVDAEGNVQQALRDIVAAFKANDDAERKTLFRRLLETRYAKVVALASQNGSNQALRDTMRAEYNVSGTTLDRAARFYLDAAEYSGVVVSPHWSRKGATSNKRRRDGGTPESPTREEEPPAPPRNTFTLHQSLSALLTDLERLAPQWDEQEKKTWLDTFHVILDYAYPAKTRVGGDNGRAEEARENTERPQDSV